MLSPAVYNNRSALALVCPITRQVKGYPFEVVLPEGLPVAGAILADQIKNVDRQGRNAESLCALPEATTRQAARRLARLLPQGLA